MQQADCSGDSTTSSTATLDNRTESAGELSSWPGRPNGNTPAPENTELRHLTEQTLRLLFSPRSGGA